VTSISTSELWRRVARAAGIDAVYGAPFGPLEVVPVPDALAPTFGAAHQRVYGRRAAIHRGDGVFVLPAVDVGPRQVVEAGSAEALVADLPVLCGPGEAELRLTLGANEPVADLIPSPPQPEDTWVEPAEEALAAMDAAASVVVLAGPGVVRHGAVPGLHDLAVAAGLGVLNTWGAKGVFDWRSRHHLATVGLQADDFVLSGLGEVDLIIATGLDRAESPDRRWKLAPALLLPPGGLAPFAERCGSGRGTPRPPPLRDRLAGVTQRGWSVENTPIPPSRVTLHYAQCLAEGALIAADPGVAGFWVARTLGTTRLGAVIVPSSPWPGFAAACVAVSLLRRPSQPALAVTDRSAVGPTAAIVDAAATLGLRVPVEVWDPEGDRLDAASHRERLRRLVFGALPSGGAPSTLATDPGQMAEMIEAAGPIVAWT
jgi:Thiamine pyrophosphate enzyme, central domain